MVLAVGKRKSSTAAGALESKEDCLHLEKPGSEDEILENLKDRYSRNLTFTNIGSTSCIVVNPRKALESFSDASSAKYAEHAKSTSSDKTPLPAHIFQLADSAYTRMIREEADQSIILRLGN
jgi:chitin synthase